MPDAHIPEAPGRGVQPAGARARLRQAVQLWRLRRSGLFDAAWYRAHTPDLNGADPAWHYLTLGGNMARDPGPAFSSTAYLAANRDVAAAGMNPLLHYVTHGWISGRPTRDGTHTPPALPLRRLLGWRDWLASLLRPVLRRRRVLRPLPGPSVGGRVRVETRGVMPTGWVLVRAHIAGAQGPARLHVLHRGLTQQVRIATDGSWTLARLPDTPTQLALPRGAGPRSAADGRPPMLEAREIGALEGRFRAWLAPRADGFGPTDAYSYREWIRLFDSPTPEDLARLAARVRLPPDGPRFSLIVPVYNPPAEALTAMLNSVRNQVVPNWELCLVDDGSTAPHVAPMLDAAAADPRVRLVVLPGNSGISAASNAALATASGDWAALLDHDDTLAPHALAVMAAAIAAHPDSDVFYSDEDKLDAAGQRHDPYFKPDFSPELLHGQNLISHLGVYRMALLRQLGGFRSRFDGSQDYDLALRATAATSAPVIHVPHVLYHWRLYPGSGTFSTTMSDRASEAARAALRDQLAGQGVTVGAAGAFNRVHYPDPAAWPRVTAIVPTRDGVDVLRPCLLGLLDRTDYASLEIMVADNGSTDPQTLAFLADMGGRGVRVLALPGPFNYSAINNAAAAAAGGDMLLFLNNDISMIEPDWLRELVRLAGRPRVGAVGARLLYPDDALQHGGVVLGMGGVAGHVHLKAPPDDPGYFSCLALAREVGAVTAACMLVPAGAFAAVGGFDAVHLPIAFNDVDLCLRLRAAGLRVLWTPHAVLHHWESRTRGDDFAPDRVDRFMAEIDYMRDRWAAELDHDPFYNPNLSLDTYEPAPAFPPRATPPWASPGTPP